MIVATSLIPRGFDAIAAWPFVFIRPTARYDAALIAHEMVHYQRQAWITPLWWLRYAASRSFRWREEVLGHRAQIAAGGITLAQAAERLLAYRTGHTRAQALAALSPSTTR